MQEELLECQNPYIINSLIRVKLMNNDINVINDLDMSIWGLILEADFVVRLVMLSLLFCLFLVGVSYLKNLLS